MGGGLCRAGIVGGKCGIDLKGLGYAGCLFVGDRRYDAAAKKMADLIDDTI